MIILSLSELLTCDQIAKRIGIGHPLLALEIPRAYIVVSFPPAY